MVKLAALVAVAAASGGCSFGARYFSGVDDRLGPGIQTSLASEGVVSDQPSTLYSRYAMALYVGDTRPSEEFPGENDEWSAFGINIEGGTQFALGGTDEGRFWLSLGMQAGYLTLTKSTELETHHGEDTWETDSESHYWGGPILRVGYGWVSVVESWTKPHCENCHDSGEKIVTKKIKGPELGIGYAWFTDLGSGITLEFTFLNLLF
jgi:hypothetical protein